MEGFLEVSLELEVSCSPLALVFSSGFASLGLESSSSLGMSFLIQFGKGGSLLLSPWVEFEHLGLVGEWILLCLIVNSDVPSYLSELGLNLIRVDNSGNIGAFHDWSVQSEVLLLLGGFGVGAKNGIQGIEGILGEDNKSAKMSTWGKLEDI